MERLINEGNDESVFAFRRLHLASGATTTVVVSDCMQHKVYSDSF